MSLHKKTKLVPIALLLISIIWYFFSKLLAWLLVIALFLFYLSSCRCPHCKKHISTRLINANLEFCPYCGINLNKMED